MLVCVRNCKEASIANTDTSEERIVEYVVREAVEEGWLLYGLVSHYGDSEMHH